MGVKNLTKFLKKHDVYDTFHVSVLRYSKIAIDVPVFMYKFKSAFPPNDCAWLGSFINFIAHLRKWDIHPIFVFEGKSPVEKMQTQEERREQKQKIINKTNTIQADLEQFIKSGTITPLLIEISKKKKRLRPMLVRNRSVTINIEEFKEEIERRRRFEISITAEDVARLKQLFALMGVCHIQSSREAETDCVTLFYDNAVDYVMSEDTDVLAYFCSGSDKRDLKMITCFEEETFVQVSKRTVLDTLQMSSESFRDFCIMCGTDYNKNIFRVGIENSFKLISAHRKIENVPLNDVSILNHKNVRNLFTVRENEELCKQVAWTRFPPSTFLNQLEHFVFTNNLNINVTHISKCLLTPSFDFILH